MERENEKNTTTGKPAVFAGNTSTGSNTLINNTMGAKNVAMGDSAMKSNTTGLNNSARGYFTLLITIIT